jgi:hypothetical protein
MAGQGHDLHCLFSESKGGCIRETYFWITNNKSSKLNILNNQIDVNKET